jgi:HSP20 family protein
MRYRHLSYRYVLVTGSRLRPLGYVSQAEKVLGLARLAWRPPADVVETPQTIVVTVELAGVDESEIDLLLFEDTLVMEGHRRLPRPEGEARYDSAEIRQGPFRLEVPLASAVDSDRVEARYERGLVTVTLPKAGRG